MKRNEFLTPDDIEWSLINLSQISFEVTDACNLNCTYCGYGDFYSDYDARNDAMLPFVKAELLVDYLSSLWSNVNKNSSYNRNVDICFYGGEPLLNMPFIERVVERLKKQVSKSRYFTFSMTTNALLLHRHIDYLVENRFHILVSLDGAREGNGYRVDKNGIPAFDRIIANVDLVKEKYPDYFEEYVNFNAVLHNKNSVEGIYRFFKRKYNKMPRIGELNNMGIRVDKIGEFEAAYRNTQESLSQSEHYSEIMKEMATQLPTYASVSTYLSQTSPFVYKTYNNLLFGKPDIDSKRIPTGTCIPFAKKIFITVNGKLLPCEKIGHQFALGFISDTGVDLDFQAIADKYNRYYAKIAQRCKVCLSVKTCTQCIFNLPDLETACNCHGFMTEKEYGRYVNAQLTYIYNNPEEYSKIMKNVIVV